MTDKHAQPEEAQLLLNLLRKVQDDGEWSGTAVEGERTGQQGEQFIHTLRTPPEKLQHLSIQR